MQSNAANAGLNATRLERVTQHLEDNYLEAKKISGCQLLVARHGQVAHHRSLGLMDIERNLPMRDDTLFRIYSMTKPITSIALMQLYEQGLFQLNDPITRVIPSWRDQQVYVSGEADKLMTEAFAKPTTFRDILSHMAGLSYGATKHPVDEQYRRLGVDRGPGTTLNDFVSKLAGVPLHYHPGTRWMYSYATDVCGYLIEALSGQTLDIYLQQHIFDPLGHE